MRVESRCVVACTCLVLASCATIARGDYKGTVLADQPVAYYRLNGPIPIGPPPEVIDSSGNDFTGFSVGNVTVGVPGAIVGDPDLATHFEAVGRIDAADPLDAKLNLTQFSIEAWVKTENLESGSYPRVLHVNNTQRGYLIGLVGNDSGGFNARTLWSAYSDFGTGANFLNNGPEDALKDGAWYHIAATFNGSQIALYVNGLPQATSPSDSVFWGDTQVSIGARNGGFAQPYTGSLDELAVYSSVLSAEKFVARLRAGALGDMNGDGAANNLDIAPFAQALTERAAYDLAYPNFNPDVRGDIGGDGAFNNLDIAAFAALLTGGASSPVPEPATWLLACLAAVALAAAQRRRSAR